MLKLITFLTLLISTESRLNFCPWGNYPVCGSDNITYENQCDLAVSYVELLHSGPCRKYHKNGIYVTNCDQKYIPICGRDGVTYLNICRLEANNIIKAYDGPCGQPDYISHSINSENPIYLECNCIGSRFRPLCSLNGNNYENECILNCSQQIPSSYEPCQSVCDCPKKYRPVCGVDGLTYDNKCTLNCVKVVQQGKGECPSLLRGCNFCSRVFLPVCGTNNITYRNLCEMRCNNVRFEHFGKCKEVIVKKFSCEYCSNAFSPICGTDGLNYQNECQCTCKGNCKKYSNGKCPEHPGFDCKKCSNKRNPVCGSDGKTYDNSCFCNCSGNQVAKSVPCIGSSV